MDYIKLQEIFAYSIYYPFSIYDDTGHEILKLDDYSHYYESLLRHIKVRESVIK